MALPTWAVVAVDAVAWAAFQAAAGYAVHRLPDRRLEEDGWLLRPRRWEGDGAFYAERLRIRRWKGLLPEGGTVFDGGFDKRHLRHRDRGHLRRHVLETRRAELGHWLSLLPAPLFVLWNPPGLALAMPLYALAVNGPCIAAQRYNRLRLQRVLARLDAQAVAAERPTAPGSPAPTRSANGS